MKNLILVVLLAVLLFSFIGFSSEKPQKQYEPYSLVYDATKTEDFFLSFDDLKKSYISPDFSSLSPQANGWVLLVGPSNPCFDTSRTGTTLGEGFQTFSGYGDVTTSFIEGYFQLDWVKEFWSLHYEIPDTLVFVFKLSNSLNLYLLKLAFAIQDSMGYFCYGTGYDLDLSPTNPDDFVEVKFPIREILNNFGNGAEKMANLGKLYLVFRNYSDGYILSGSDIDLYRVEGEYISSGLTKVYDNFSNVSGVSGELYPLVKFKLAQNYPNPFNPSTTIKYSIPSSEFVTLKVYDILGNEVSTLVNEEKPAGNYEVNFNALNLPSGAYFYRLQTGSLVETKKMILLK